MPDTSTPAQRFAATTANGTPLLFVYDPERGNVHYYDRTYAGRPGFSEHGQDCGPAFPVTAFTTDAVHGIQGWHEVDAWDIDARTVRLVANWLKISGWAGS